VKVVLFEPQIPQNAGNVVRTCSVTGCGLIFVRPLGFCIEDRWLKRAGLDYWEGVSLDVVDSLDDLVEGAESSFVFFSSKAKRLYTQEKYHLDHLLIFGSETHGLPRSFTQKWEERGVTIPMKHGARCLNLATSVGIGLYEAIRQTKMLCR